MKCSDCLAWKQLPLNENFGHCKRHAPSPSTQKKEEGFEYVIVWPVTGKDDPMCFEIVVEVDA